MSASLCVFVFIIAFAHTNCFLVKTTEGIVEGYKAKDGDYYEFYGIPYAGPTDGAHRFKDPVPPTPYQGVFHANNTNITCAQPSQSGLVGIENCLTLNVFTNNVTTSQPVIVWLYADDYTTTVTQTKFSFKTFVEQHIVFVSLNFRVSIFGFLCLGIKEAPGNAGLRDVLQGLKWINSNIAHFGGDPNNVVLMGHASGAAMVDMITMAPQAKGLVHKAIALSGSSVAPWAVAYDPIGYAQLLGAQLGYTGKTKEDLAKFLTSIKTTSLNSALVQFSHFRNNTPLFAPCIENLGLKKCNKNETVLSDAPIHILQSGNYLQIPYITGYTTREGTMRASEAVSGNWLRGINENFTEFLPADLYLNKKDKKLVPNMIADYYFNNYRPNITMNNIDDYFKYEGDTLVVMPVIKGAKERSQSSKAEVRLLIFGYLGTHNTDWHYQIPLNGVKHGGMLNYLFDIDLRAVDTYVMESLVNHFATFAKSGNQDSNNTFNEWLPITSSDFHALKYVPYDQDNFDVFMKETNDQLHDRTSLFWKQVYQSGYNTPKPVNDSCSSNKSAGQNSISFGIISSCVVFLMLSKLF